MKSKFYIILYYVSVLVLIPVLVVGLTKVNSIDNDFVMMMPDFIRGMIILVGLLTIAITYFLIRKKKTDGSICFPIGVIIFTIMGFICVLLFNDRVMVPYIHFGYYAGFILIAHLILDIYTLLGIKYKD